MSVKKMKKKRKSLYGVILISVLSFLGLFINDIYFLVSCFKHEP